MPNRGDEIRSADVAQLAVVASVAVAGGAQSVSSSAQTVLQFSAADLYDTTGMHDPAVNNTRTTIITAGQYIFIVYVDWNANATGNRTLYIQRTRAGVTSFLPYGINEPAAVGGFAHELNLIATDQAIAGDYYEAVGFQTSGTARIVAVATFTALRIGS